jgi:hypothetical protein
MVVATEGMYVNAKYAAVEKATTVPIANGTTTMYFFRRIKTVNSSIDGLLYITLRCRSQRVGVEAGCVQ